MCFITLLRLRTSDSCRWLSPWLCFGLSFAVHWRNNPGGLLSSSFAFLSENLPSRVSLTSAGLLVIMHTGQVSGWRSFSSGRTISSLKSMEPKTKSAAGSAVERVFQSSGLLWRPRLKIDTSRPVPCRAFNAAAAAFSALLLVASMVRNTKCIGCTACQKNGCRQKPVLSAWMMLEYSGERRLGIRSKARGFAERGFGAGAWRYARAAF